MDLRVGSASPQRQFGSTHGATGSQLSHTPTQRARPDLHPAPWSLESVTQGVPQTTSGGHRGCLQPQRAAQLLTRRAREPHSPHEGRRDVRAVAETRWGVGRAHPLDATHTRSVGLQRAGLRQVVWQRRHLPAEALGRCRRERSARIAHDGRDGGGACRAVELLLEHERGRLDG
eukprot:5288872-Prymnesium_polylepis.1